MILYNTGPFARTEELSFMQKIHRVKDGIPKRIVGAHYCFDDDSLRPFVSGLKLYAGDKSLQGRFRPHFGNHENINFELQTFGIPITDDHPVKENGSLCLSWHHEWLQIRQAQEAESESGTDGIIVPRRFDVLFGRGESNNCSESMALCRDI